MYKVLLGYLAVACLLWYIASFRIHTKKRQSRRIFNDELNATDHEQQDDLEPGFTHHQQQKAFNSADNFSKANETPTHEETSSANLSLVVQSGSSHVVQPTTAPSCQGGCTKAQQDPAYSLPRVLPHQLVSDPKRGERLASGSFGVVFKGNGTFPTESGTVTIPVAIKVLRENPDPEAEDLEYEANVLNELQQVESNESSKGKAAAAKIPMLFDFRTVNKEQVMTTQLLDTDLEKVAREGGVAQEYLGHYAEQIFRGLKNMHDKGFVHCDIKPENLMVNFPVTPEEERQVYIVDFGLAQQIPRPYKYEFIGSLAYMSESALAGDSRGFKRDVIAAVYSLLRIVKRRNRTSEWTAELPWEHIPDEVTDVRKQIEIVLRNMRRTKEGRDLHHLLFHGLDPKIADQFRLALRKCNRIDRMQYYEQPKYEDFVSIFVPEQ